MRPSENKRGGISERTELHRDVQTVGAAMEWWLWLGIAALAALVGVFIGAFACWRVIKSLQEPQLQELRMNMASDRELLLCTLRRELANYLVRLDQDRFHRLYREARGADVGIGKSDKASQQAQLALIAQNYPFYRDFDLLATREHVLYADALNIYGLEDIEAHYLNIVKFHSLTRALDENWWARGDATSDRDLEHLEEYVQKIKDTKFRQRLIAAIDEFSAHSSDDAQGRIIYETDILAVYRVPHFAETRYGFHFKDTNEFGLCGSFYHDVKDKFYQSLYRSDPKFEIEGYLDYLHIEERI
jgi:hypothetical protein